jgi:hypothetical protein
VFGESGPAVEVWRCKGLRTQKVSRRLQNATRVELQSATRVELGTEGGEVGSGEGGTEAGGLPVEGDDGKSGGQSGGQSGNTGTRGNTGTSGSTTQTRGGAQYEEVTVQSSKANAPWTFVSSEESRNSSSAAHAAADNLFVRTPRCRISTTEQFQIYPSFADYDAYMFNKSSGAFVYLEHGYCGGVALHSHAPIVFSSDALDLKGKGVLK